LNITCSNCDREVPEGATQCPTCNAGVGTVLFGKQKSLTRTLIGKALDLRSSIPWASASAVILVEDTRGRKKVRPAGLLSVLVVLGAIVGGAWFLFKGMDEAPGKPEPVVQAPPVDVPPVVRTAPPAKPVSPATVKRSVPAVAPAAKTGTLTLDAVHKGKPTTAKVLINGKNKGNTPLSISLVPGKYTVAFERKGLVPQKKTGVKVDAGRNTSLRVDLKK
jgi:hypothetical protein